MSDEVYIKWLEKRSLSQMGQKNTQYGISPLERMGEDGYIQWRQKQKVCRIGSKNPNAKSMIMYNASGFYMEFEMLIECARFLKDNSISNASELKCIQKNISTAIHKGSKYLGYNYKFKINHHKHDNTEPSPEMGRCND